MPEMITDAEFRRLIIQWLRQTDTVGRAIDDDLKDIIDRLDKLVEAVTYVGRNV